MADIAVDVDTLPEEIREKLAELDLELSEGKCIVFISCRGFCRSQTNIGYTNWLLDVRRRELSVFRFMVCACKWFDDSSFIPDGRS